MDDRSNEYQPAPPATAEPAAQPGAPLSDQPTVIPDPATRAATPPQYPAATSYPGFPPAAPYSGAPSGPAYPGYPAYPTTPSAPMPAPPPYQGTPSMPLQGYPPYQGTPSMPLPGGETPTLQSQYPPTIPATPSMPLGGYPSYPGYPSAPGYPSYPGAIPPYIQPPKETALSRPFPLWLTLTAGVGAVALVGVVYALGELVGHDDWAGGAKTAGFVAIGLAFVAAVALVIRLIGGRRAGSAILLGVLLVVALAAIGAGGVGFSAPLHSAQAHSQESAGQWTAAIGEYGQAGEAAPNAPDIARVYDEWGEKLLGGQSYKDALGKFSTVTGEYGQSGAPVARANSDTFQTYSAWVKANASDTPYADALTFLQSYGTSAGCDSSCQTTVKAVEAQAHYQYGQQYLAQQDYADAISQFETVTTQFAQSGYASQAHSAAAQALLSYGQQLKSSACSNALPIYQKLVSQYGDTAQGQQAKSALAAPVSVSGQFFTNASSGSIQTVIFAKTVDRNSGYQSNDYQTSVNASGQFTFASVAQGTYNVLYMSGGNLFVVTHASDGSFYTVTVGQLCSPAAVTIRFG